MTTSASGEQFSLRSPRGEQVQIEWSMIGRHNVANACAAVAAAHHVGVPLSVSAQALSAFRGVKRRLELRGEPGGVEVYDDFAHHPTAIATTLEGLRARERSGSLIAVIEPRSNTMRGGEHRGQLAQATILADHVFWYEPPGLNWSLQRIVGDSSTSAEVSSDLEELAKAVACRVDPGDTVVVMSNGGFGGFHDLLIETLAKSQ